MKATVQRRSSRRHAQDGVPCGFGARWKQGVLASTGADHLYSVSALTDASGNVVERYAYDSYGKRTTLNPDGSLKAGAAVQDYGFTGREWDAESGLWYFRRRMYSDGMGRFVSRDPLGYVDGMSLYSCYFASNAVDPFGLNEEVPIPPRSAEVDEPWHEWHIDVGSDRPLRWDLQQRFLLTVDDANCHIAFDLRLKVEWPAAVTEAERQTAKDMWEAAAEQWSSKFKVCCCDTPCPEYLIKVGIEFVDSGEHHRIEPKAGGRMDFIDWIYRPNPDWPVPGRAAHELGHLMGTRERYGRTWEGSSGPDVPGCKWTDYETNPYPGKMGGNGSQNPVMPSDFEGLLKYVRDKLGMNCSKVVPRESSCD